MKLIILILLFSLRVFAPKEDVLYLPEAPVIEPFKSLIYAVGKVECNFDTLAYNIKEQAAGYFQIRPIRVQDYNNRTGSNLRPVDMFDYETAERVFLYFAHQIGPYDIERIARNWNGKWSLTENYWKRIQAEL